MGKLTKDFSHVSDDATHNVERPRQFESNLHDPIAKDGNSMSFPLKDWSGTYSAGIDARGSPMVAIQMQNYSVLYNPNEGHFNVAGIIYYKDGRSEAVFHNGGTEFGTPGASTDFFNAVRKVEADTIYVPGEGHIVSSGELLERARALYADYRQTGLIRDQVNTSAPVPSIAPQP